jgi:hypothetical protein
MINAGSRPALEVVESADGDTVTIRNAGDQSKQFELPRTILPLLIKILNRISE